MSTKPGADNAIQYVEITGPETEMSRPEPQMPSACETGGCGCASGASQPLPTYSFGDVIVNGTTIDEDAIAREMQHHPADTAEQAWQSAARALVIKTLLLQQAEQQGIAEDAFGKDDSDERVETLEDSRVRTLLEQVLTPEEVHPQECQRYYTAQTHRFRTPELFEASHILIEPNDQSASAWQEAKAFARTLIAQLGDDEALFAEAAEKHSGCPTAHQSGSLGQIRRGELEQSLQDVLETLGEGCVSREPVRSRFGWHLVRLHRRIEGRTLPFDLAREKIQEMLEARAWMNAASNYVASLAEAATINGVKIDPKSEPEVQRS